MISKEHYNYLNITIKQSNIINYIIKLLCKKFIDNFSELLTFFILRISLWIHPDIKKKV